MQSLKNGISLDQVAKISGYTEDYLGYLIRSGEMKGIKKGRAWFTTEKIVVKTKYCLTTLILKSLL